MARIALCLQGGGSRGTYVAGPLALLMEKEIWADAVWGTSCGSLMGLYAQIKRDIILRKVREQFIEPDDLQVIHFAEASK